MDKIFMLVTREHAEAKHGIKISEKKEDEWLKLHLIDHFKRDCDHNHYTSDLKTPV